MRGLSDTGQPLGEGLGPTYANMQWDTYWCVQVALTVHSQIEFGLHPLYGHHSQPHWNKVEHGWEEANKRNKS